MKCLIIASGPSLTQDDVEKTRGKFDYTIVINDNYKICPWADLLYACDNKWWLYHKFVPEFSGEKISPFPYFAKLHGLSYVTGYHGQFSTEFGKIAFGGNSGFQALNLAALKGFKEIYLLGYDCSYGSGKAHWFGDHPAQIHVTQDHEFWIQKYREALPIIESLGVRVINLSRETAIDCFERMTIDELPCA